MTMMMTSKIFRALAATFLLGLAVAAAFGAFLLSPADTSAQARLFTVSRGQSARSIVDDLAREGFIRSGTAAYAAVRLQGLILRAGTFRISPAEGTLQVLGTLVAGREETRRVTIPEGLSLSKTARHLGEAGVVNPEDFLEAAKDPELLSELGIRGESAEGYLFPDTYFFPYEMSAAQVVRMMAQNFLSRVQSLPGVPSDPEEFRRAVILASVVEREYRVASEAPLIASVFRNRIKIGMGLQSCATVEYIITEIQGKPHPYRLLDSDLAIQSDYNTYLWAALPPGPICSPGTVALSAAFNPARTDYLYFRLVDPETGSHAFTRSLEEHVRAGRSLVLKASPVSPSAGN